MFTYVDKIVGSDNLQRVIDDYYAHGYSLYEVMTTLTANEAVTTLSHLFYLGQPYERAMNDEEWQHVGELVGKETPTTLFHSDVDGEMIQLFDAVAAFQRLQTIEPRWAEALCHRHALRCRSILPHDKTEVIGPVFERDGQGRWRSRFTLSAVADWEYSFKRVPYLREALGFLVGMMAADHSLVTIPLERGQGVIVATDRYVTRETAALLQVTYSQRPTNVVTMRGKRT